MSASRSSRAAELARIRNNIIIILIGGGTLRDLEGQALAYHQVSTGRAATQPQQQSLRQFITDFGNVAMSVPRSAPTDRSNPYVSIDLNSDLLPERIAFGTPEEREQLVQNIMAQMDVARGPISTTLSRSATNTAEQRPLDAFQDAFQRRVEEEARAWVADLAELQERHEQQRQQEQQELEELEDQERQEQQEQQEQQGHDGPYELRELQESHELERQQDQRELQELQEQQEQQGLPVLHGLQELRELRELRERHEQ